MTKYEPLTSFLAKQERDQVPLSFREVERVLGFKLPESAFKHRPWWANTGGSHVQSQAWLEAGFETEAVDMQAKRLVFRRVHASANTPRNIDDVYGRHSHTIRINVEIARPWPEEWSGAGGNE